MLIIRFNVIISGGSGEGEGTRAWLFITVPFKDDLSHGKSLTEKLETENSLLLKPVLENLIRSRLQCWVFFHFCQRASYDD